MKCGKLTAKLRDAVPICFIEEGKEIKRVKNIEIPDAIKELEYKGFKFDVPMSGAITFKIYFEPGTLPETWPEPRQRKTPPGRKWNRSPRPWRFTTTYLAAPARPWPAPSARSSAHTPATRQLPASPTSSANIPWIGTAH